MTFARSQICCPSVLAFLCMALALQASTQSSLPAQASSNMESGFAEINGGKIYYEVAGSGHALVLIHDAQMDLRRWDEQIAHFSKTYNVIHFDVRGFGQSPASTNVYASEDDLADFLKILHIEMAYVAGLSLGGRITIDFASLIQR